MIFQSGPTTVWFDPLVPPRLRYTAEDLPIAFADEHPFGSFVVGEYGPQCEQLTVSNLPRPDAVFVSHPDIDHFDLGVLMCLPEDVPIVVPPTRPDSPWDVSTSGM